jgi:hypothetical protein
MIMGFGANPASQAPELLDGHNLDDCQCPQVRVATPPTHTHTLYSECDGFAVSHARACASNSAPTPAHRTREPHTSTSWRRWTSRRRGAVRSPR